MRFSYVAALVLVSSTALFSQEFRATISGAVTDPAGAAVAGVKVTATETRTGTKTQTVSDSAGQYVIPFLAPGQYEIAAQASGFREFIRRDLTVASSEHPVIDIRLQVGDTSTTVDVSASAPLVDTANASMGQSITTKQVEDLPLNGRTPMMLAQLAVGVIATGNPTLVHPFDNAGAAAWSIGGSPAQTSELLIDGSPDATWDQRLAYSPPQDAVQEVAVKAFDTDAAYGHTNAGTANQILKTGTNTFHGSAYEFTQASALDANNFFNNRSGIPIALTHFNQYGLTAGAPVFLPKVYNGKNKLFWFFAWENLSDAQPTTDFTTVPTAAERQGNFSALNYQLYDPYTGVLGSNNVVTRQALTGNIVPQNYLNPIALAYLKYYPQPNITPLGANGFDNYANTNTSNDSYDNELGRIDYNMSEKSRMFFDIRHNYRNQAKNNYFGNAATGTNVLRENWGGTLDEVYMLNPSTVFDVRANFTRMNETHFEPSMGFDPTQLGFPSYIAANSQYGVMPSIGFGSCGSQTSFQCLGDNTATKNPSQSWQLFGDVVKIQGNHTLKIGTDLRQYRLNNISYGNSAGGYTFGNGWVRAASNSSSTLSVGQDFASFLMGLPTAGQFDINAYGSFYSYYYSGFVQDDWRVKPTFTLNLGIRFDHDAPYSEKYGRTVDGFAFTAQNPVGAVAVAAYNKNPIAQIPAGSFAVPGGLTFATPGDNSVYQNTSHLVSPRIGFSWSPARLRSKTVFRGGFGMFVAPVTIANLSANGGYSSTPIVDQEGFSQTTSMVLPSNFLAPSATLSNPFPTGILQPVGSAQGLATFNGQTISFLNPEAKNPYSIRWNFGVQHTFGSRLLLEVDYMGNHAVHLPISVTQLNVIPRQYLSTLPVRDQTVINTLTASVANPFAGLAPGTSLNNATTTVAQLLARFPEYPVGEGAGSTGVIMQNNNAGSSYFESLNLRIEKRLSRGLSIIGTYMYSKLMEEDSYLNDTDLRPEKRVSPFDHPHHLAAAFSYELPVGKDRALDLRTRWINAVLGGWVVNGIYTFQTGAPIAWMNGSTNNIGDYVYYGGPINVNNREANVNTPAFNTSVFNTAAAQQFQYHIRTFSTTFGNLRQDGINNLDTSLLKRFNITERIYFQLRFEAFNVINHPTFAAPNTTATNGSFGLITSQANLPRQIQLGARFVF
jgi:hypothetical protein